jgi:hypothetical protein
MACLRRLWAAVSGDAGGDHHRPRHHPVVHSAFDIGGVQEQTGKGGVGQRPAAEGSHLAVQLGADAADLRFGDPSLHT